MSRIINNEYNKKKFCSTSRFNKYTLVKNPMKGGTPAKENKNIVKNNKYELSKLNVFNEYIVLRVEL